MRDRGFIAASGRLRYIAPGAVILVVGIGAVSMTARPALPDQRGEPRNEAAIEVVVRRPQQQSRSNYVAVSGEMEGRRTVKLGFKVAGVVARVIPEEGDEVKAGQVIAELESDAYELGFQMASAGADRARDGFARAKRMHDEGSLPAADFVAAETGVRQAIAQEALAKKNVTDTKLIASITGRVAMRMIQPSEQVAAGMPVFVIISTDPVDARVGIPEAQIGRIRQGQAVAVRIPSLGGANFAGRVRLVGVAADPVSRTYTVRIAVPNPDGVLRPGMIAEVRISDGKEVKTLTLPGEAIVRDAEGASMVYVFEANENRVRARRVDVGSVFGKEVEITSGLNGNEMVVVGGMSRLRAGALVKARVIPAGTTPGD